MIIGTGIDLVDSRRIQKLMDSHEKRFIERYFTDHEANHIEGLSTKENKIMSLAKRFAAKEACAKALGTGFRGGIYMKDIEVKNDALGKPILTLFHGALEKLKEITPEDMPALIHLSMSDEPPYAQAQVIIEVI